MTFNWIAVIIAALVPTLVGFVWYHPKVMGNAWMKASGLTEESLKGANMAMIFGVSLVLSILLAFNMNFVTIHQMHLFSLMADTPGVNDPSSEAGQFLNSLLERFNGNYRSFKHGALHGALSGVFFALPILGTSALFERKGFKYIAVNAGYWIITLALMGGVICGMV
ncbi:MAG: DUF1761 domain-containing protein [Saprospiraceae bacterium]|jgi:Protein of unknown function (DUF1761)|nr:DUF1761 domain-containing protein [Saprospiraceae bacterium]